jgi:hypothetical protein
MIYRYRYTEFGTDTGTEQSISVKETDTTQYSAYQDPDCGCKSKRRIFQILDLLNT